MCPASTPFASSSSSRWTDEEHNILVEATDTQIALETKDKSLEVPWPKHWQHVSSKLQDCGYSRTPGACQIYWRRIREQQEANEEALGPTWEDAERELLFQLTKDQIALEASNPATVIPWPKHWKNVSIALEDEGYSRNIESCAAFWMLYQADAYAHSESTTLEPESETENEKVITFQSSSRSQQWLPREHNDLAKLIKDFDLKYNGDSVSIAKKWEIIANQHLQNGYSRTWEALKRHWAHSSTGTPNRSKERLFSTAQKKGLHPLQASVTWPAIDDFADERFEVEEPLIVAELSSQAVQSTSGNLASASLVDFAREALISDELGNSQGEKIQYERYDTHHHHPNEPQESKQFPVGYTGFRFQSDQRLVLQAELEALAASSQRLPSKERRIELANQFGVVEKSIKNWFVNHRHQRRESGITDQGSESAEPETGRDYILATFRAERRAGLNTSSESNTKRRRDSMDNSEPDFRCVEYPNSQPPPSKKSRLEDNSITASRENSTQPSLRDDLEGTRNQMGSDVSINETPAYSREHQIDSQKYIPTTLSQAANPLLPQFKMHHDIKPQEPTTDVPSGQQRMLTESASPRPQTTGQMLSPDSNTASSSTPSHETCETSHSRKEQIDITVNKVSPSPISAPSQPLLLNIPSASPSIPSASSSMPSASSSSSSSTTSKLWAERELHLIQAEHAEISQLNITRKQLLDRVDQDIHAALTEAERLCQKKEDDVAQVMKILEEIRERYARDREVMMERCEGLRRQREREVGEWMRGEQELARKGAAIESFRGIVEYYS